MNLRNVFALSVLGLAAISTPSRAEPLVGLVASGSQLIRFDSNSPTAITAVNISGLNGAVLRGIDLRPNDGRIFGIASNNQLFTVDAGSGVATFVANLTVPPNPGANSFGVDFNPVPDSANPVMPSLRVVNNLEQNLRIQAVSGVNAPGFTISDGPLAFSGGDPNAGQNPTIVEEAYTNNVPGATTTALLGIDARLNVLVQQNPANAGTLVTPWAAWA